MRSQGAVNPMSSTSVLRPASLQPSAGVHISLRPRKHFALFEKVLTLGVCGYFVTAMLLLPA